MPITVSHQPVEAIAAGGYIGGLGKFRKTQDDLRLSLLKMKQANDQNLRGQLFDRANNIENRNQRNQLDVRDRVQHRQDQLFGAGQRQRDAINRMQANQQDNQQRAEIQLQGNRQRSAMSQRDIALRGSIQGELYGRREDFEFQESGQKFDQEVEAKRQQGYDYSDAQNKILKHADSQIAKIHEAVVDDTMTQQQAQLQIQKWERKKRLMPSMRTPESAGAAAKKRMYTIDGMPGLYHDGQGGVPVQVKSEEVKLPFWETDKGNELDAKAADAAVAAQDKRNKEILDAWANRDEYRNKAIEKYKAAVQKNRTLDKDDQIELPPMPSLTPEPRPKIRVLGYDEAHRTIRESHVGRQPQAVNQNPAMGGQPQMPQDPGMYQPPSLGAENPIGGPQGGPPMQDYTSGPGLDIFNPPQWQQGAPPPPLPQDPMMQQGGQQQMQQGGNGSDFQSGNQPIPEQQADVQEFEEAPSVANEINKFDSFVASSGEPSLAMISDVRKGAIQSGNKTIAKHSDIFLEISEKYKGKDVKHGSIDHRRLHSAYLVLKHAGIDMSPEKTDPYPNAPVYPETSRPWYEGITEGGLFR